MGQICRREAQLCTAKDMEMVACILRDAGDALFAGCYLTYELMGCQLGLPLDESVVVRAMRLGLCAQVP